MSESVRAARKQAMLPIAVVFLCLCVINIEPVMRGMRAALDLCAASIIPSLFLFLVVSDCILSAFLAEGNLSSPKRIIFFLGAVCGFPMGGIICDRLCHNGALRREDAKRLLPYCNSASPAFLIGSIGSAMLKDTRIGILLYAAQTLSSLLLFLFVRIEKTAPQTKASNFSFSDAFFTAVEKAIGSILRICALLCIFSAVLSILRVYCGKLLYILLASAFEIGNGAIAVASMFAASPELTLFLLGIVCGWSGICVHLQIFSAAKSIKVNYFDFALKKGCIALLTGTLSVLGYKIFFCT